jgi:hypothetical protein
MHEVLWFAQVHRYREAVSKNPTLRKRVRLNARQRTAQAGSRRPCPNGTRKTRTRS